jgi:N-acetylneuraminic acid mutarotase
MSAYLDYLVSGRYDDGFTPSDDQMPYYRDLNRKVYYYDSDEEEPLEQEQEIPFIPIKKQTIKRPKSFKTKKIYRPPSENPVKQDFIDAAEETLDPIIIKTDQSSGKTISKGVSFDLKATECYRMHWRQASTENFVLNRTKAAVTDGYNGKIYIHGGRSQGTILHDLFSYDVDNHTFQNEMVADGESSPFLSDHHMLPVVGKHLYLFAGNRYYIYLNALMGTEEILIEKKEQTQKTPLKDSESDEEEEDINVAPKIIKIIRYPRRWSSFTCKDWTHRDKYSLTPITNGFIVFGGKSEGKCMNHLQKFTVNVFRSVVNTTLTSVTQKNYSFQPEPRFNHSATYINNRLYIFGGTGPNGRVLNDLCRYDITQDIWEYIQVETGIPPSVFSHDMVADIGQRYLYVYGGTNSELQVQNTLHRFDTDRSEWQLLKLRGVTTDEMEFQAPITHHKMVSGSDAFIVFGGSTAHNGEINNHISVLDHISESGSPIRLQDYMNSRFKNGLSCDIALRTISEEDGSTVQHEYIYAHKCVLASRCQYFTIDMLEQAQPDQTQQYGVIPLDRYHTLVVHAFIQFLYSGSLPPIQGQHRVQELLDLSQELDPDHYQLLYKLCTTATLGLGITNRVLSRMEQDFGNMFDCCEASVQDMLENEPDEQQEVIQTNPQLLFTDCQVELVSPLDNELLYTLPGHKIMLCRSSYIDDAFKSGMEESLSGKIKFSELSLEGMLSVLRFMYTSQISIKPESCIEVFLASLLFSFPELAACSRSMVARHLTTDEAIAVLQIAQLYDDAPLKRVCVAFIVRNYEQICGHEDWEHISLELKQLIELKYLQGLKRRLRKQKKEERKVKKKSFKTIATGNDSSYYYY